ncbi:cysteine hydrolase [Roseateles sp. DAIF2]|uniref:cysteine hydrolase family protein n=1 Tax=Roseateles sp. DAIF2 TaxID=2714952 RepID=UPI0018A27DA7|nr:cysteine hydrolase family protein [Roseateles sp. DAIF2]QPF71866.1 cysteine hydrolase [Roseateles sp. DAIF2]
MPALEALLIIDMQRALLDPEPRPYEVEAVIERINALSARARAAGAPVIFVLHEREGTPLTRGSEGWQLQPGLRVESGDLRLHKTTPDSFNHTELQALLQQRGVQRLAICGYASEFCVDTTTRRAAALGYPVRLVADAHTTHDKPHADGAQIRAHHNATLSNITSFGPRIEAVPSAELRFEPA